jgi:O-methyltransferase
MVRTFQYLDSIYLTDKYSCVEGDIVECGVWKGGMSLGMIEITKNRDKSYHFFDSFAGLPPAEKVDGSSAIEWQNNKIIQDKYKNCEANYSEFQKRLELTGVDSQKLATYQGFFEKTLSNFPVGVKISVLRLDADWYKSTMECLNSFYDSISPGGIIIIDDYYTWDGCTKAIHDFLSTRQLNLKIRQTRFGGVAFIVKE